MTRMIDTRVMPTIRRRGLRLACASTLMACLIAAAGPVIDKVAATRTVRVCIWPDYYGVTFRSPRTQELSGIDIELSHEFAKDLGARLVYVDSSFASLIADLDGDRCDVAMFAIGVLPQRQAALKFSQPYLQSDIFGITTRGNRAIKSWADIDRPGIQVAVQAGTFMEPVMASALKQARLIVIKPPQTREGELEAGRVDVFMTDYPYSRRLLDNADWAKLVAPTAPFHILPYAYAVKPGDEAWLRRIDGFVSKIKTDGRLQAAASHNGLADIVVAN